MFDTQHMSSSNVDCMQCFLCTVLVGWCVLFCTDSALWHAGILQWTPAKGSQDPRNKIIHASPLRKRREEKAFEVGELVNGDEFE